MMLRVAFKQTGPYIESNCNLVLKMAMNFSSRDFENKHFLQYENYSIKDGEMTWGQFHQCSLRSFCANSLAPVKYNLKCKHNKAARATYVRKSCA
jgi:hypothetical protein